ncbi:GmrSD restriction endonuclease domain-containing protein [[Mycoplasma] testudinis]|uniref:GmrSD restriction endonuclease domain-containing protein n=1 Tax=[Mycoplasma] testudinis TaxID=33924 RepID=UPI000A872D67|nr:DUF1524 domain-containing protein [[Mycoplasma] testudinis]
MQTALIIASIDFHDSDEVVEQKIQIVSKYLTKLLTWRVWNHMMISQSSLESSIYGLCKIIRRMSIDNLKKTLNEDPLIDSLKLENPPTLNQQNQTKVKVLLALITEIVAKESNESDYLLDKPKIEIEHIWNSHFEEHRDEFDNDADFKNVRNWIGDLLLLPKSINASHGDDPYEKKVKGYFGQNILAQSLNEDKYKNNPGFLNFIKRSNLEFKPYKEFKKQAISERAKLYEQILLWNWRKTQDNH